jgi:uncharacterized protein YbjT (DUF2867 family)
MTEKMTLITGATGKTGRRVADRLRASQRVVRAGSRSGQPAFDWEDRTTWPKALDGVDAVYLTYYPDLAAPGAVDAVTAFVAMAVAVRVRRLVLLSGRGEPEAQRCEEVVAASGLEWTVVRASWFNQNFSENYFLDQVLAGHVALPAGPVSVPFVDADDIADVAAAALLEDRHVGQLYELTGPRPWTFEQAIGEIARVTGRDIRYEQVGFDAYAAMLEEAQVPADVAALILYLFREVLVERNGSPADGVERALGRPSRRFEDYVRDVAATGVWTPPPITPPQGGPSR